jgi:hypothetical protein
MAGRKLPALPSLAEAPASDDIIYLVDVSDTSESPEGTSKQVEFGEFIKAKTDFAPTASSQVNGTATISTFVITEQNGIVDFACSCRFILDGGQTNGTFQFDLPTDFEPTNNWASELDMYGYYQVTNPSASIIKNVSVIGALSSKLVSISVESDTAAQDFKLAVFGRYNRNN